MGMGIQPPFSVSMETRTLPLFAHLVAPSLLRVFSSVALDWGAFRSGSFCQSLTGAQSTLLVHTHTSWSCLLRKVGLRFAAEGTGAAHRELSVFLSLFSDTEKRAFLGLRKQRFSWFLSD
ncbi:hypothetical protein HispidOSU_023741 [Sigmodon hispidus]